MAISPSSDNYALGKGVISFNRKVDGVYQGYRDLGNAPNFTTTLDITPLNHFNFRSGIKAKDKIIVQEVTPSLAFTLDEVTDENFALSLMGELTETTQVLAASASKVVTPTILDRYYDLDSKKVGGVSYIKFDAMTDACTVGDTITGGTSSATAVIDGVYPTTDSGATAGILTLNTIGGIFENDEAITGGASGAMVADGTSVVVADGDIIVADLTLASAVVLSAGVDYFLDTHSGKVNVMSGGTPTIASSLTCIFSVPAATFSEIGVLGTTEIEGMLHFVSDNPGSKNYELIVWSVSLTPSGDSALIGDDWLAFAFDGEILKDEAGHPTNPYCNFIMDITT